MHGWFLPPVPILYGLAAGAEGGPEDGGGGRRCDGPPSATVLNQDRNRKFRVFDRPPTDEPGMVLQVLWTLVRRTLVGQAGDLGGTGFSCDGEVLKDSGGSLFAVNDAFQPGDNDLEVCLFEGHIFGLKWGGPWDQMWLYQMSAVGQEGEAPSHLQHGDQHRPLADGD